MPKCGYVVRLSATDRTIVNSGFVGFYNEATVGLCLEAAGRAGGGRQAVSHWGRTLR
ncbi:hypothetical protein LP419_29380 [Massilia sp. H-1]|nr:hypothetical protein LP419_29380 [Massilia sp. H-1]